MISSTERNSGILKKRNQHDFSAEGLKINWNWLYLKSPLIFGSILGIGTMLFIFWFMF